METRSPFLAHPGESMRAELYSSAYGRPILKGPKRLPPIEAHRNRFEITLSQVEIQYVKFVAEMRISYDRECEKIGNWKSGNKTREKLLNPIGAELAFCKAFNLYPDFSRRFKWYDATLPDGRTVDVKHTDQDRGHLIAALNSSKKRLVDLYVLMVGEFPTYEFRGVIPAEVFIRKENVKDLGHGPCYAVDQSRLSLVVDW